MEEDYSQQKLNVWAAPRVSERLKGNSNSQDILNWIIQILQYYYRKQHKNIENSQIIIIEQNFVLSLPFSLLTAGCASSVFLAAEFFQFLDTVRREIM